VIETFKPRLDALPSPQRKLWGELTDIPSGFVLYGGTALALRLGHRISEDFDFFSNHEVLPDQLEREIPFLAGAPRLQSSPHTLVSLVDRDGPVKVSFFGGLSLRRVRNPDLSEDNGLLIASLLDLAATKVKVVQDRAEAKDYIDLSRLLEEGIDLADALGAAQSVYGESFSPLISLKALSFFNDGNLRKLDQSVRSRLSQAVGNVQRGPLPEIPPLSGGLLP
jgi:hypothetical protein